MLCAVGHRLRRCFLVSYLVRTRHKLLRAPEMARAVRASALPAAALREIALEGSQGAFFCLIRQGGVARALCRG